LIFEIECQDAIISIEKLLVSDDSLEFEVHLTFQKILQVVIIIELVVMTQFLGLDGLVLLNEGPLGRFIGIGRNRRAVNRPVREFSAQMIHEFIRK
jgi:hypothetical protein